MQGSCAGCPDVDPPTFTFGSLTIHDRVDGAHDFNSGSPVHQVDGRWELVDRMTVGPADYVIDDEFL